MPSFVQEMMRRQGPLARKKFIEEMDAKAPRRKPKRTKAAISGTMAALRNKRVVIREAAARRVQIILTYKKTTDGTTNRYVVAPYSYRYRRMARGGIKKLLFAFDMDDRHIKGFVLANIRKVVLTDRRFRPKWPVEIG